MAKTETKRVIYNMPVDLLSRVDSYAERMNINRTSATFVLLSQALDGQQALQDLSKLMLAYEHQNSANEQS